jgi:hypothetical protein
MKAIQTAVLFGSLFIPAATFGSPGFASAQDASQQPAARTPDEVVNMLAARLNLTDDQKVKIQPIVADRQQKLAALRADASLRPMQKKRKLKGIFEDSDKKIKALLDQQQKQQYTLLEQQLRDQMRERRASRGGASSPDQE